MSDPYGTNPSLKAPDDDLRAEARKRVVERRGFLRHLVVYVVINIMFWVIWAVTGERTLPPWPIWPMLGWGLGVVLQGVFLFGRQRDNLESAVDREVEKLRSRNR